MSKSHHGSGWLSHWLLASCHAVLWAAELFNSYFNYLKLVLAIFLGCCLLQEHFFSSLLSVKVTILSGLWNQCSHVTWNKKENNTAKCIKEPQRKLYSHCWTMLPLLLLHKQTVLERGYHSHKCDKESNTTKVSWLFNMHTFFFFFYKPKSNEKNYSI